MKFQDICTCKIYTDREGKEKKTWPKVGVLKTTDAGKQFIELNMNPDVSYFVFEQKNDKKPQKQDKLEESSSNEPWLEEELPEKA